MTNNNTNPSNPREDELDEILHAYGHEYWHQQSNMQANVISPAECFTAQNKAKAEAKAALKSREATMQAEARMRFAEEIVSHSTMDTGSLRGGVDTFTIEKRKLWELAAQTNGEGNG